MTRYRLAALPVPLAALTLVLAACGAGTPSATDAPSQAASAAASEPATASEPAAPSEAAAGGEMVMLVEFQFEPTELTIAAGTEVTFMNGDSAAHTVTEGVDGEAAESPFIDEELEQDATASFTFDEAGEFQITCLFHDTMNMTVTVE